VIPDVGSHGCVGLDEEDAKTLYQKTPTNTPVEIITGK
jgi:lipoprotein-anchoring transpeptidase ErfK/SrfK